MVKEVSIDTFVTSSYTQAVMEEWEGETVDISNDQDIERWCKIFHCDKEDLLFAVRIIGDSPKLVNEILELNRRKHEQNT